MTDVVERTRLYRVTFRYTQFDQGLQVWPESDAVVEAADAKDALVMARAKLMLLKPKYVRGDVIVRDGWQACGCELVRPGEGV